MWSFWAFLLPRAIWCCVNLHFWSKCHHGWSKQRAQKERKPYVTGSVVFSEITFGKCDPLVYCYMMYKQLSSSMSLQIRSSLPCILTNFETLWPTRHHLLIFALLHINIWGDNIDAPLPSTHYSSDCVSNDSLWCGTEKAWSSIYYACS